MSSIARKSDPRTLQILHAALDLAQCRFYGGRISKDGECTSLSMYPPQEKNRGKNIYEIAELTLGAMVDMFLNFADRAFELDQPTVNGFKSSMWDEEGNLWHPSWREVEAAMN